MKVSRNELTALYKQALEGCGLDTGAYTSAAECAVWAHMLGLQIYNDVHVSLQQCATLGRATLAIDQTSEAACAIEVGTAAQARGITALLWAQLVADLIFAHATTSGQCTATVRNVRDPLLGIKTLIDAQARGMHSFVYGSNPGSPDIITLALTQPEHDFPEIIQYELAADSPRLPTDVVTIVSSTDTTMLANALTQHCCNHRANEVDRITPQQLHASWTQSLEQGIDIPSSLWSELTRLATNVLVANSEQSRRGAGA